MNYIGIAVQTSDNGNVICCDISGYSVNSVYYNRIYREIYISKYKIFSENTNLRKKSNYTSSYSDSQHLIKVVNDFINSHWNARVVTFSMEKGRRLQDIGFSKYIVNLPYDKEYKCNIAHLRKIDNEIPQNYPYIRTHR